MGRVFRSGCSFHIFDIKANAMCVCVDFFQFNLMMQMGTPRNDYYWSSVYQRARAIWNKKKKKKKHQQKWKREKYKTNPIDRKPDSVGKYLIFSSQWYFIWSKRGWEDFSYWSISVRSSSVCSFYFSFVQMAL